MAKDDEKADDPAKFWPAQAEALRTGLETGWPDAGTTLLEWIQAGYREVPRDEDAEEKPDPCQDPCNRPKITYWHVLDLTEDQGVIDARDDMSDLIADYHEELVACCSDLEFPVMMVSFPFAAVIRSDKVARENLVVSMLWRWNQLRARTTGLHDDVFWEFYTPLQSWRPSKHTAVKQPSGLPSPIGGLQRLAFRP